MSIQAQHITAIQRPTAVLLVLCMQQKASVLCAGEIIKEGNMILSEIINNYYILLQSAYHCHSLIKPKLHQPCSLNGALKYLMHTETVGNHAKMY